MVLKTSPGLLLLREESLRRTLHLPEDIEVCFLYTLRLLCLFCFCNVKEEVGNDVFHKTEVNF